MKKLIAIFYFIGSLYSCAYLQSGATTKIKIRNSNNKIVKINNTIINDTINLELKNKFNYKLQYLNPQSLKIDSIEEIKKTINSNLFLNIPFYPYIIIDFSLGSNWKIIDGKNYSTIPTDLSNIEKCEETNRNGFKSSVLNSALFLLAPNLIYGLMLGMAQNGVYASPNTNRNVFYLSFGIGYTGVIYNIYKTYSYTKKINYCINNRVIK